MYSLLKSLGLSSLLFLTSSSSGLLPNSKPAEQDGAEEKDLNELISVLQYLENTADRIKSLNDAELTAGPLEVRQVAACAASVSPLSIASSFASSVSTSDVHRFLQQSTYDHPLAFILMDSSSSSSSSSSTTTISPTASTGTTTTFTTSNKGKKRGKGVSQPVLEATLKIKGSSHNKQHPGLRKGVKDSTKASKDDENLSSLMRQYAPTPECLDASQSVSDLYAKGAIPEYTMHVMEGSTVQEDKARLCAASKSITDDDQEMVLCVDREAKEGSLSGLVTNGGSRALCSVSLRILAPLEGADGWPKANNLLPVNLDTQLAPGATHRFELQLFDAFSTGQVLGLSVSPDYESCSPSASKKKARKLNKEEKKAEKLTKKKGRKANVAHQKLYPSIKQVDKEEKKAEKLAKKEERKAKLEQKKLEHKEKLMAKKEAKKDKYAELAKKKKEKQVMKKTVKAGMLIGAAVVGGLLMQNQQQQQHQLLEPKVKETVSVEQQQQHEEQQQQKKNQKRRQMKQRVVHLSKDFGAGKENGAKRRNLGLGEEVVGAVAGSVLEEAGEGKEGGGGLMGGGGLLEGRKKKMKKHVGQGVFAKARGAKHAYKVEKKAERKAIRLEKRLAKKAKRAVRHTIKDISV